MRANAKAPCRGLESDVVPVVSQYLANVEVAHYAHPGEAREENEKNAEEKKTEDYSSTTGMLISHTASLLLRNRCRGCSRDRFAL